MGFLRPGLYSGLWTPTVSGTLILLTHASLLSHPGSFSSGHFIEHLLGAKQWVREP